ncbi:DUF3817 domain-containing protein [Paenibacillus caseinilyticus]|uniref:Membrane protein n=1 Tax=Paenibacillus mucilaginosus K02 TaxID=997761 RepID=I0BHQ2_9BACL|nr:DUF3817 domain-containing protein [Paenibacillus mucilaginosus]AFH61899.1 membrane protein [Paenibacillus mucilaginosus K02]
MTMRTPIGRLRVVGLLEGISFLLLLGIAMPLKYMLDLPQMVSVVGMAHGVLFVAYLLAVAHVTFVHRWSLLKVLFAVIASFLPFGTFMLDARLKRS